MNVLGLFGLLAVAVLVVVALVATRPELIPTEPRERVWTVEAVEVARGANQPDLKVYGELVAGRTAEMRALVQGQVVAVGDNFHNGASVSKGDLLVEIDRFEYETAIDDLRAQIEESRARIAEAEARQQSEAASLEHDERMLDLRRRELERVENLHGRGNVSDKALDDARLQLAQQAQAVARGKAAVKSEDAKQAQQQAALQRLQIELRRAERDLERTRLTAPFDGFLADVNAEIGQRLSINDGVVRVVGADQLEARGHLSGGQYGRLLADGGLKGRPAKVAWQIGDRALAYDAEVSRITAEIRPETGGITFYALLSADGLDLPIRPGAFVSIVLPDRRFPDSVRLPLQAVHDNSFVYVIGPDDRLVQRQVRVLARPGEDAIVDGELETGDAVVLTRYNELAPGVLVRRAGNGADRVAADERR